MFTLLLADAELERVPPAIAGHPQVVSAARRAGANPTRMLLDSSLHHAAMTQLPEAERRGRPDIIHVFLLTALESMLNKAGHLQVLVHTRDDGLIRIDPTTRLVRNYNRFCGLVQQLFETSAVPPEKPLLTLERGVPLQEAIKGVAAERILVLDEQGTLSAPWSLFEAPDASRRVLAIVGGFPSGRFRSPLPAEGERVSFGRAQLSVWTVAAELLAHYERVALPPP